MIRPSAIPACSASGIEAAEGLAWSSTVTITLPGSSPSAAAPEPHELAAEPSTPSAQPTSTPADPPPVVVGPPPNLQTAEGMALVLDQIRKRFGDTTGYELAIMSDEALLARPDPTDDSSKLIYTFERGWGDPSTRPRSDTDDVTDLGAFDVQAAAAALQAAQGCDNPVLIRVEVAGSHGYRPTDKLIAERADQWAFAAQAMGIE